MTTRRRKATAFAFTTLALFATQAFALTPAPEASWWDDFVAWFQPADVAAPTAISSPATPKSRCIIIVNGVTTEAECD